MKIIFLLLILCSCSIPKKEEGFLYPLFGQTFRQIKYRSIEQDNLFKFHYGIRTMSFKDNVYTTTFQNYYEFTVAPCYGDFIGTYQEVEKDEFLTSLGQTGALPQDTNGNGVYDIFEPYQSGVVDTAVADEKAEVQENFFIVDVKENNLSAGCAILQESKQYLQTLLYENGDLVLRDYNREIEFYFRPIN